MRSRQYAPFIRTIALREVNAQNITPKMHIHIAKLKITCMNPWALSEPSSVLYTTRPAIQKMSHAIRNRTITGISKGTRNAFISLISSLFTQGSRSAAAITTRIMISKKSRNAADVYSVYISVASGYTVSA